MEEENRNFFAENGDEVFKMREIESLDIVITDLEMPKMNKAKDDGNISQDEKIRNIPIVFWTGQFSLDHHNKAKKLAKMFLPKPLKDKKQLFSAIEKVTRKKQLIVPLKNRNLSLIKFF